MKRINIKIPFKRVKMHRELRLSIIALLALIIIVSSYTAYSASQESTTIEQITPTYLYTHSGIWDYQVYITNNSLYDTNILKPGEGTYFKKLIDYINMSYKYQFFANQQSTINGLYDITAEIQTNLWSKDFIITPSTPFNSNTNKAEFTAEFLLNTTVYEDFITKVNQETDTSAGETVLIIKCTVLLTSHVGEERIDEKYSSSLQVSLGEEIVEIEGELITEAEYGALEETKKVYQPGVTAKTNTWTSSSILIVIICIGFILVTESELEAQKSITKQIKKIEKKYGEWTVEVEKPPKRNVGTELVITKSMDDLVKISEELGKPIIHYPSEKDKIHMFYVLDEVIHYQYTLSRDGKTKKSLDT